MNKVSFEEEVWKRFIAQLKTYYGGRRFIAILVFANIAGYIVVYGICYLLWGQDNALQNTFIPIATILIIEFFVFAFQFISLAFFVIPQEIYNEQLKRIEMLSPEKLEISIYRSNIREIISEEGNKIFVVAIEVYNQNQKLKIVELEAEISHFNHTCMDSGNPMTLPFFIKEKAVWQDDTVTTSLRPSDKTILYIAYLSRHLSNPSLWVHFGQAFTHHLFERESMYQIAITFTGKMEGENEFRRNNINRVIYANPSQETIYDGEFFKQLSSYDKIPEEFKKILEVAEEGYWYDYSSPYRRQQEQRQKENKS